MKYLSLGYIFVIPEILSGEMRDDYCQVKIHHAVGRYIGRLGS